MLNKNCAIFVGQFDAAARSWELIHIRVNKILFMLEKIHLVIIFLVHGSN